MRPRPEALPRFWCRRSGADRRDPIARDGDSRLARLASISPCRSRRVWPEKPSSPASCGRPAASSCTKSAEEPLIGAAPSKPGPALRDAAADRTAAVLSLALGSFNAGVRGYYFALAALAWLVGPGAFALATTGMVAMLLWRQFGSDTAEAIRLSHAVLAVEASPTSDGGGAIGRGLVAPGAA